MRQFLLTALVFLSFQSYAQCLLKEVSLQQRTINADLIVEGRVIGTRSFWNEDHTMIYTANTIEVLKLFKGNTASASIEIITPGGSVGYSMIKANPSLNLSGGEVGIFLCETIKRLKALPASNTGFPRYEVYASVQGFLKYDLASGTATDPFKKYGNVEVELYKVFSPSLNFRVVKPFDLHQTPAPSLRTAALSGFSPSTVTAGTGTVLTINGSGFGATQGSGTVRFRDADNGGSGFINPLPSQYLSWNDNQITVVVPSGAGTGTIQVTQGATFTSASPLTVSYSPMNVDFDPGAGTIAYQTDHINDNGSGGYTWRMNTGFDGNAAAKASFLRAFDSWRCGTEINWTIGTTTSVNDAISDGTNVICFDNTAALPGGVLGICYSYWSGCASGPTIVWYVNELDIIFDEGSNISPLTWEFGTAAPSGSEYDFETVAVHELGHGHQLGHVISPGAIMHFSITNGTANRSLGINDLAGGNFVQVKSETANVCGPGAMTAYTGCSTLPVTISSVTAYKKGNDIQVEWTNLTESGVRHYEVEESVNGIDFTKAALLYPKSNNSLSASYKWLDKQVYKGTNFYRIISTGYSGEVKYSSIAVVNMTVDKEILTVYPNPVKGNMLGVALNNLEKGSYVLSLYNASGQEVMSKIIAYNGGNSSISLSLPAVAPGVYRLQLQGNVFSKQHTVVIGD